jgi:uncharacterized membrane-anchored protein
MNVVNHAKVAVLRLVVLALACITCLLFRPASAQQQQSFQQPSVINPIQWQAGPIKLNLGDAAEINIPEGYQFLDEKAGRLFLEGNHNPVPNNMVGILAPVTTRWFAVINFSGIGYVKDTDATHLDAGAMLNKVQSLIARQNESNSKNGLPMFASADWELKPVYDPTQNKLEWAIRAAAHGDIAAVNYSVRLFGRRGVLEFIAVQPYQADFDLSPLREIVKGISFRDGERYSDYKSGDMLANVTMAQLAVSENRPGSVSASSASKWRSMVLWGAIGLAVLLFAGVGIVLLKNLLRGSHSHVAPRQTAASSGVQQPVSAGWEQPPASHASAQAPVGASAITLTTEKSTVSREGITKLNGRPSKQGRRRKKQYNFHLFYSDMIMNLTRWNYVGGFGTYVSDYAHGITDSAPGQVGDDANGTVHNGNGVNGKMGSGTNGTHGAPTPDRTTQSDAAKSIATETSKLIENQQKLIEGQRKLIEEQNKLIQEKSKLIDFESAVLEKQSEMVEEQGLL